MHIKTATLMDRKGVVAVEFALLLPIMILIWAGIVEFTNLQSAARKVNLASHSVADIVAQEQSVTQDRLDNIIRAATIIMTPFPTGSLTIGIQSIETDADGNISVGWETGSLNGIPAEAASLVNQNDSTIHVLVTYTYQPVLSNLVPPGALPGITDMNQQAFAKPRLTTKIPFN